MVWVIRRQLAVDENRAVHLQSPELEPGNIVVVIVLSEDGERQADGWPVSFLDGVQITAINAPPDFSAAHQCHAASVSPARKMLSPKTASDCLHFYESLRDG